MLLDQNKWTSQSVHRNRISQSYEPVQPYILLQYMKEVGCTTFFDIGANIGLYTILAASCAKIAKIYAFEPDDTAYAHLLLNIESNNLSDVAAAFHLVVSDRLKMVKFGVQAPASGINAVTDTSIHGMEQYENTYDSLAISIDELYIEKNQIISIKIDVEGHEHDVIGGLRRLLAENSVIMVTAHPTPV